MNGAIAAVVEGRHGDPFAILGPHEVDGRTMVRAFIPGSDGIEVIDRAGQALGTLKCMHPAGFFEGPIASAGPYRLRVQTHGTTYETEDPYRFGPTLGDLDLYLHTEGRHRDLGLVLGAHLAEYDGVSGTRFAVWAPNAQRVSVVGDFNYWNPARHPMRKHLNAGVWDIFLPGVQPGTIYKFDILGPHGERLPQKADPVAWRAEVAPATGSIVAGPLQHEWSDHVWLQRRAEAQAARAPISAYEVHAASWLPAAELGASGWDALADRLAPYCAGLGFTHLELLPIMEHPFGGSWGYQPLGQFAPSSRLGPPEGFARFVDRCHAMGVGVILDWVPAHFPTDAHGLARFDGTAMYEHADPREGFHRDWNTFIYTFGRREVQGFLIASALYWLGQFHVDGLRVDAVASMLYRDYSRKEGEWIPNSYGGRENLESIGFLRRLNALVAERAPGAVTIAEESTAWPGVSAPIKDGGLGFSYKWNMGWMHDTLEYLSQDPVHRRWHHNKLTFGLLYAFSERFILPLSHDEVVYGKGSMFTRAPGDSWQKLANLRAYYAFMWTHPGKKLLFMGNEIGQKQEWSHDGEIAWDVLQEYGHAGLQRLVRDLNHLYLRENALHHDADPSGFRWIIGDDADQSVYAYERSAPGEKPCISIVNMTPVPREHYRVGVPLAGPWREILNTDSTFYGGSNLGNGGVIETESVPAHGFGQSLVLVLPPLAALILKAES